MSDERPCGLCWLQHGDDLCSAIIKTDSSKCTKCKWCELFLTRSHVPPLETELACPCMRFNKICDYCNEPFISQNYNIPVCKCKNVCLNCNKYYGAKQTNIMSLCNLCYERYYPDESYNKFKSNESHINFTSKELGRIRQKEMKKIFRHVVLFLLINKNIYVASLPFEIIVIIYNNINKYY